MTDHSARTGAPSAGRFIVLLVLVVVILVSARWALLPDHAQRNVEYMPEMTISPAVESQTLAAMLPQGISQQPLVAGVVPRGTSPFRFGPDEEEAKRAGRELVSPIADDDEAAASRGADIYRIHCVPCHDVAGEGHGPAVLRGMQQPPLFKGVSAMEMPDGQMFHLLTMGRGNMPAMRARIDAADRWAVIRHVRVLQTAKPETAPETSPDPGGEEEDQ